MSDFDPNKRHDVIYVSNFDVDGEGRQWCEDKQWDSDECDKYMHVDLVRAAIAEAWAEGWNAYSDDRHDILRDITSGEEYTNSIIPESEAT